MTLELSPKLKLPTDAVTQTFVIFGKRGTGKTNTATVMAEEMIALAPVVILTPLDNWWGLKSSFNGKGDGLNVYVFGGAHGDLPLDPESGELMARLFIEHRISMVLCMKGWSVAQRARFVTAFCTYLLAHNDRVPVHVILEEADAYVPQRPQHGEEAMLGATDRLIRWGRGDGIGATMISQRSAKINKDVTTQAETLIAHRTIGPQDRDAIEEWIKFHGSADERREVLSTLATLKDGEAWVWSPEWLGILLRVQIRRRRTFDSAATPKIGEKRIEPKVLTAVDVERLRDQLSTVIAKAKQDDPKELRKQLASADREIASMVQEIKELKAQPPKTIEVVHEPDWDLLTKRWIELTDSPEFRQTVTRNTRLADAVATPAEGKWLEANPRLEIKTTHPMVGTTDGGKTWIKDPRFRPNTATVTSATIGKLSEPQQRILDALAGLEVARVSPAAWTIVAMLANQSPKSSGFEKNISVLRGYEFVTGNKGTGLALTKTGRDEVRSYDGLTIQALHGAVLSKVSGPQSKMLGILIPYRPDPMPWDDLARLSNQSPTSSGYEKNISVLRGLGLIEGNRASGLRATEIMFL